MEFKIYLQKFYFGNAIVRDDMSCSKASDISAPSDDFTKFMFELNEALVKYGRFTLRTSHRNAILSC